MKTYAKQDNLGELIESVPIYIIEFGSTTCAPCTAIRAKLDSYIRRYDGIVNGVYIPIENNVALSSEYGVFSVPSVQVYVQGKRTICRSGYFSVEEIERAIDRYITLLE